jgi:hypothetical protein
VHLCVCVGVCGDNNRRHSYSNTFSRHEDTLVCATLQNPQNALYMLDVCNVLYILISHLRLLRTSMCVCVCVCVCV